MSIAFAYNIKFPITKENYVDQLLKFDECFLRLGAKFELYHVPEMDVTQFIKQYKDLRRADFFGDQPQAFRPLDPGQLQRVDVPYSLRSFQLKRYGTANSESGLSDHISYYELDNLPDHYAEDLANEDFWYEFVTLSLSTFSDEWEAIDASIRAELIPRINSFIRELTAELKTIDGVIEIDEYTPECFTVEGIRVDGKITYAEEPQKEKTA